MAILTLVPDGIRTRYAHGISLAKGIGRSGSGEWTRAVCMQRGWVRRCLLSSSAHEEPHGDCERREEGYTSNDTARYRASLITMQGKIS